MTQSMLTRTIASLSLLLCACWVQADPGRNGKGGGPPGKGPGQELRKQFDKDSDGKPDPQKMAAARQAMQARGVPGKGPGIGGPGKGNGPANENGPGNGPGREAILKRFDKNGDGKLDDTERAAAHQAMEQRGGQGAGRKEVLKRFDQDGDGKLNEDERAAARKAMEQRKNK